MFKIQTLSPMKTLTTDEPVNSSINNSPRTTATRKIERPAVIESNGKILVHIFILLNFVQILLHQIRSTD